MGGEDLDAELDQAALDAVLLHRVDRPLRDPRRRRDERDVTALTRQQLGQHAAHVVVIVVVEHDAIGVR